MYFFVIDFVLLIVHAGLCNVSHGCWNHLALGLQPSRQHCSHNAWIQRHKNIPFKWPWFNLQTKWSEGVTYKLMRTVLHACGLLLELKSHRADVLILEQTTILYLAGNGDSLMCCRQWLPDLWEGMLLTLPGFALCTTPGSSWVLDVLPSSARPLQCWPRGVTSSPWWSMPMFISSSFWMDLDRRHCESIHRYNTFHPCHSRFKNVQNDSYKALITKYFKITFWSQRRF